MFAYYSSFAALLQHPISDINHGGHSGRRHHHPLRDTFHFLPESGAALFTVRTYMTRLVDIEGGELVNFAAIVGSFPGRIATYKGCGLWGQVA
jgi:hypothetical protein